MNKLVGRSFLVKLHLSLPSTGSKIDNINDLENGVTEEDTPLDEKQQLLAAVTLTGIQKLESLHTRINCKKIIHSTKAIIGVCDTIPKKSNS